MRKWLILVLAIILTLLGCGRELSYGPEVSPPGVDSLDHTLPVVVSITTLDGDQDLDDYDDTQGNLQDEIHITFSKPMDEASLRSYLIVYGVDGRDQDTVEVTDSTYIYDEFTKTLVVKRADGFVDSTYYLVVFGVGITDMYGNPLDGNGNGLCDDELDVAYGYIRTPEQAGLQWPDFTPVQVVGHDPGSVNDYNDTLLTVTFSKYPIDLSALEDYIVLTNTETGEDVNMGAPDTQYVAGPDWTVVRFHGFTLEKATLYKVTVSYLVSDTLGNTLDGDGDGVAELEDNYEWCFFTDNDTTDADDTYPPCVSSAYWDTYDGKDAVRVEFERWGTGIPDTMDTSTFTSANLRIYDDAEAYPCKIVPFADGTGLYLIPYGDVGSVRLFVSKEIMNQNGMYLDGDGDGIGGEEDEDNYDVFLGSP